MSDVSMTAEEAQAAAGMALGQAATAANLGVGKKTKAELNDEFLAEVNQGRKNKYTDIQDYLTNNGKLDKNSDQYSKRLARLQNFRGTARREEIVVSGNLLEEARKLYGSVTDLYNVPELKSIFEQAFINKWTSEELLRAIDASDWAKTRTKSQEQSDLQKTVDPVEWENRIAQNIPLVRRILTEKGISISEDQIKTIAEKGTRNGWTGNQWDEYSASDAISFVNAGQPQQPGQPAAQPVVSQVTATDLRTIAKNFGVPVTDATLSQWVNDISTNRKSQDQFTEYARSSAQTLYPSLSERLKTNTFDQIMSPYKQLYAEVLETPQDNIDLTNPTYSNLYTSGDPAKPRMMTSTEWVGFLRKRPEWQNTQNAYREYAQAASTLDKIFGGTR